jgi:hypothetical protein
MSDADERLAQIVHFRELMLPAVSNGSGVKSEVVEGVNALKLAILKFEGALTYNQQQLDFLVALRDQLELILSGSLNADLLSAEGNMQTALRDSEDFSNRIQAQINNLGKISAIIRMQLEPIVDAIGALLKQTNDIVEEYAQYL